MKKITFVLASIASTILIGYGFLVYADITPDIFDTPPTWESTGGTIGSYLKTVLQQCSGSGILQWYSGTTMANAYQKCMSMNTFAQKVLSGTSINIIKWKDCKAFRTDGTQIDNRFLVGFTGSNNDPICEQIN